jgi:Ion channel
MFIQIALGSGLLLLSILTTALSAWVMELAYARSHPWLMREPHRLKLMAMIVAVSVWVLGVITAGIWIWAGAFYALGAFGSLEEAVYFAMVTYTTLGFGDLLLPEEWRLLAGMAAANGLLNFGLLTALFVEALRHVSEGQTNSRDPRI